MYKKILVALENGPSDETVIPHICALAHRLGSELLLVHVADGFAARNFDQLKLAESDEMKADREYLESRAQQVRAAGLQATTRLALGNPPNEIVKLADAEHCELIAMTSHGHKVVGDFFLGSTISRVRHNTTVPLLVVRAGTTLRVEGGATVDSPR